MKYTVTTRSFFLLVALVFGSRSGVAQPGQLSVPRVEQMPNLPAPYAMRDWKEVARQYDAFVFSQTQTGTHLPLVGFAAAGINYPTLQPILLDTYVGTNSHAQAEAINIIPAIVGASLVGIDKAQQNGIHWVEKIKDFYNAKNRQDVYLNSYSALSGNDWWYDVMPNVFFYQLYSLYPDTPGFAGQYIRIADRWLEAVQAMGGKSAPWTVPYMHYRGWYLAEGRGNTDGVKEPEAAGAIAWLLYHAYRTTHDKRYLNGARQALDFLAALNANPSYELQLPYGVQVAAAINANERAGYDVGKMLNWCFDRGPLRGWGTIVGTWDGQDVSGLIGEANDQGNDYAFLMNGYQQAAALVPLTRYDKRYARAIAKWILNLANASRLLYPAYLPADQQDDYAWSSAHDPQSVIAYEALKESWQGTALYGTGDAKRNGWAQTNLGLYGSSHVGYLASVVATTDVEGILALDVNKTDFTGDPPFASYLLYNPHDEAHVVTLGLGDGSYDVYDAIRETVVAQGVSGNATISIAADEAVLLTYLPAGTETTARDGMLYAGDVVVDYHYRYDYAPALRIKSLAVAEANVGFDQDVPVYATLESPVSPEAAWQWTVNDQPVSTSAGTFSWTSTGQEGIYTIVLSITQEGVTVKDSVTVQVYEHVPTVPVIETFVADQRYYETGQDARILCRVTQAGTEPLQYTWNVPEGTAHSNDSLLVWTLPAADGLYTLTCTVSNRYDLAASGTYAVLVKVIHDTPATPFAYYPLDGDTQDYSGSAYHGEATGTQPAADARGRVGSAYHFTTGDDIITVPNRPSLNVQDHLTVSCWIRIDAVGQESFILSHGSWEERWKLSITPDRRIRWTVRTSTGTRDLDSSFPILLNKFYHVTALYTGYSLELYTDGVPDTFLAHTGLIQTTGKALTFGQKSTGEREYYLQGTLDEVRLYNTALDPVEIATLPTRWNTTVTGLPEASGDQLTVYPNPAWQGRVYLFGMQPADVESMQVYTVAGEATDCRWVVDGNTIGIDLPVGSSGIVILRVQTGRGAVYKRLVVYR
ncbi:LamG-like jellyroll fold domain-containing protein [Dawidia soli]|uniref:T9SS type A sorting domain-containing protein n=1 Tax=Dawidia soli TaxID=2782352 RepID=A0AAP2DEK4_9BACT|nr:LamG-like jellyroll fold domain-containing protein [Dawidia soli]MBT1689290.1 T9SS type A sorting domain-containing protein [Dawidia soli]